jgi:sRNA-binding carbon storage regulator CsrA
MKRSKKNDERYGLVLTRLKGECVIVKIGDIEGRVILADGGRCRLAFDFPPHVKIYRPEIEGIGNE